MAPSYSRCRVEGSAVFDLDVSSFDTFSSVSRTEASSSQLPCSPRAQRSRTAHRPKFLVISKAIARSIPPPTLPPPAAPSSYTRYETRRRDPNPREAALLVIDVQGHFASLVAPAMPAIAATVALCRGAGMPVVYTRHVDPEPRSRPLAELLPGAGRAEGDLVVEKNTYSAFAGTGLEEKLRGMGVEEVIVTGLMTNLCCETTARDAFVRGFRVFFSADATATASRDLHEATLANMAYGFAYIVDCKRLEVAFRKHE